MKGYIKAKNNDTSAIEVLKKKLNNDNKKILFKETVSTSISIMTLFTTKLEGKDNLPLKKLEAQYGFNGEMRRFKYLDNEVRASSKSYGNNFRYKLLVDYEEQKIYIQIYNKDMMLVSGRDFYFSFDVLKDKVQENALVLVNLKYWTKQIKNSKYYKFYDFMVYQLKDFTEILKLIQNGTIWIKLKTDNIKDRKLTAYDKEIPFMIEEIDLLRLYEKIKIEV